MSVQQPPLILHSDNQGIRLLESIRRMSLRWQKSGWGDWGGQYDFVGWHLPVLFDNTA